MGWVAIGLWAGAAGGVVAIAVAVVMPRWRRAALFTAAALFVPIGVLGILSVGVVFLVAAAGCFAAAARSPGGRSTTPTSPRP